MNKSKLENILKESQHLKDVMVKLGYSYNYNKPTKEKVFQLFKNHGLDIKEILKLKNLKDNTEKVECPVCNSIFERRKKINGKRLQITCSVSCSNTYFRSGENNGNWSEDSYRTTCFLYHKKECVVCAEDKVIDVHHLDGNNKNNKAENLIPLCPTHHKYWHSKYRYLVENKILNYLKTWKKNNIPVV